MVEKHGIKDGLLFCDICSAHFKIYGYLRSHVKEKHGIELPPYQFVCFLQVFRYLAAAEATPHALKSATGTFGMAAHHHLLCPTGRGAAQKMVWQHQPHFVHLANSLRSDFVCRGAAPGTGFVDSTVALILS